MEDRIQLLWNPDNAMANIRLTGSSLKITTEQVIKACTSLINRKAPEPVNIPTELITSGTEKLYGYLRKIFQDCINEQMFHKNRTRHICQSYAKKVVALSAKVTERNQ